MALLPSMIRKRLMTMLPFLIFVLAVALAISNLMTDTTNISTFVSSNNKYNNNEIMISLPGNKPSTTTTSRNNNDDNDIDDISIRINDSKDDYEDNNNKQHNLNTKVISLKKKKNLYNFTWDDIDFSSSSSKKEKPATTNKKKNENCGHYKCFFPSKTDPDIGYLIVKPKKDAKEVEAQMMGWDIAKNIELMHNARHFYLTSPILHKPTDRIRKKLREKLPDFPTGINPPKRIVVQKVLKAPIDRAVLECAPRRIPRTITGLLTVLGMSNSSTPAESSSSSSSSISAAATNTLVNEIKNDLIPVIYAEPALVLDFQVMVDKLGRIYHFDLDRADRSPKQSEFQTCICNLRKMALFFSNVELIEEVVRSKILSSSPIQNISKEEQVNLLGNISLNLSVSSDSESNNGYGWNSSDCPSDLIGFNVAV